MFDIHMHVIPAVDDGSMSFDMSLEMLQMAYLQGVRQVMATPHSSAFEYSPERVSQNFRRLKECWEDFIEKDRAFQEYIHMTGDEPLRLYPGCEIHFSPYDVDRTMDLLSNGTFPTLNDTEYVLTEFSPLIRPAEAVMIVIRLVSEGWIPVIAHVERCAHLYVDGELDELIAQGALLQINAYSLCGEADEGISGQARHLIETGKVTFLGSDAHRTSHRPPDVRDGVRYIRDHCDPAYAEAVISGNACRFLTDKD